MNTLKLSVFDRGVIIDSEIEKAYRVAARIYESLKGDSEVDLHYSVASRKDSRGFTLRRNLEQSMVAADEAELFFLLEDDMTVELQKLRPDLYFIHAASLMLGDRVILLVGSSGRGKSTTTWGLAHFGFRYLSDELAPVKLDSLEVVPYPRALCLKKEPPGVFPLPVETVRIHRAIHVPVKYLPSGLFLNPAKLSAIFFLRDFGGPAVKPVGKAEAATRLFTNALNPLSHQADGLDAAVNIARETRSFDLLVGDLSATCSLIKATVNSLPVL